MQPTAESTIPRPSLVQFSIRDLLWLMVWASLASAVVAAVLPRLSEPQRPRFLVAVGVTLSFAGLAAATALFVRARLERQAGPALLVVPFQRGSAGALWLLWLTAGAILPLLGTVIAVTAEGYGMLFRSWVFYWMAFLSIEKAIVARWSRGNALEFCENGIIYQGKQFVPTWRIIDCRWGAVLPNRLFLQVSAGPRWEIDVDPRQHESMTQALKERVPEFRRWWDGDELQEVTPGHEA